MGFVFNLLEVQALGAEGRRSAASVSRKKNFSYPRWRMLALADVDQRANDVPHHMVEKGVRADHETERLPLSRNRELMDRAHRRLRLAFGGAEGGEVVLADKKLRRLAHRLKVERQVKPAD